MSDVGVIAVGDNTNSISLSYDPTINSKLPNVGTTIFTVMSGLATEYNAVNLGQGFPDFPMSHELTGLVDKAMKDNFNQYAPMPGWMPLREAIAEKANFLYGASVNPDTEITITRVVPMPSILPLQPSCVRVMK